jgi:hypothetical protein
VGERYDASWGVTERLESLERTLMATLKYVNKAKKDLESELRDADREEDEKNRGAS